MLDAKRATTLACDDVGRNPWPVQYKGYISAVTFALDKHATFPRTYRLTNELLGHADVRTTMLYAHVLGKGAMGVKSPLDRPIGEI